MRCFEVRTSRFEVGSRLWRLLELPQAFYSAGVTRRAMTVTVTDCPRTLPLVRATTLYVGPDSSSTSLLTPTFAKSGVRAKAKSWTWFQMSCETDICTL